MRIASDDSRRNGHLRIVEMLLQTGRVDANAVESQAQSVTEISAISHVRAVAGGYADVRCVVVVARSGNFAAKMAGNNSEGVDPNIRRQLQGASPLDVLASMRTSRIADAARDAEVWMRMQSAIVGERRPFICAARW